jgi:hypothetical protein
VIGKSLRWDSKVWFRVLSDSDHWVITLQIGDPFSRQRGRLIDTRPQLSDSNIPTGSNIWSQVPQGCSTPRHTDWLTDRRCRVQSVTTWQKKAKKKKQAKQIPSSGVFASCCACDIVWYWVYYSVYATLISYDDILLIHIYIYTYIHVFGFGSAAQQSTAKTKYTPRERNKRSTATKNSKYPINRQRHNNMHTT